MPNVQIMARGPSSVRMKFKPGLVGPTGPSLGASDYAYIDYTIAAEAPLAPVTIGGTTATIAQRLSQLQAGQSSGSIAYSTLTELNANLVPGAGSTAQVTNDGTPANNGFYVKSGATGTGSWTKSSSWTIPALGAQVDAERISFGEVYNVITPLPQLNPAVGAYPSTISDGRVMGAFIVEGQPGTNAIVEYRFPVTSSASSLGGRVVRLKFLFTVNAEFTRNLYVGLNVVTAVTTRGVSLISYAATRLNSTALMVDLTFLGVGDEIYFSPYAIDFTDAATDQDDYFTLVGLIGRIASSPSVFTTAGEENLLMALEGVKSGAITDALVKSIRYIGQSGEVYDKTWSIKPDGSGDFLSPAQASITIAGAAANDKHLLAIAPGIYGDVEWTTQGFVDMRGAGQHRTFLAGDQDDDEDLALIALNSVFRMNAQTWLSGMTISARNMRYAVHPDLSGLNKDIFYRVDDCTVEHLGNDGARAWQDANGGDPADVWAAEHAWGMGTASGQVWEFNRDTFISKNETAFYTHNNKNFEKPSKLIHRDCRFFSKVQRTDSVIGAAVWLDNLGSRVDDICELQNCELSGPIIMAFQPWLPVTAADQVADKAEWKVTGSGNTPVAFIMFDDGSRALRITSADTGPGSEVIVSGTAVAVLLGSVVPYRGGGGLQGAVYGTWDIGDHAVGPALNQHITSLAYRLGNRTSSPISLSVTANGSTMTVTLDQNYTGQSNATILAAINAVLGANATASEFWASELYRPSFRDQEAYIYNADTVALRRKRAVAYAASDRSGRVMTSADAASLFAGIALEDIRPGEWGRVKTQGVVCVSMDMDRSDAGSFTLGDAFGVGATPGRFVKNPTTPLMTATNAADVRWTA